MRILYKNDFQTVMNPNISEAGKNTRFSSENQPARNGRKRNVYTVLRETGYSSHDIRLAFGEMAWHSEKEIKAILDDPEKPMIARIVAKQYIEALKKGNYLKVKEIIEHVIGKPTAKQEHSVSDQEDFTFNIVLRERNEETGELESKPLASFKQD